MIKIRKAEVRDIAVLPEIERAAASLFDERDLPLKLRDDTISEDQHLDAQRRGLLLVALDDALNVVGFALSTRLDSNLHIVEMDVHPQHQRRGIGTSLLKQTIALASALGCDAVTLTTFVHISWNAPWYQKLGFSVLPNDAIPTSVRSILDHERKMGLDPRRRVAMRMKL